METETETVHVCLRRNTILLNASARIGVTEHAVPLHHIGVALEVGDADAKVVELICELGCEAVNERTIRCGHIALCHGACNHLCHLVARDVAVAAIGAVAVALDNAVRRKLGHGVVCPVITGHVGEGIRRRERGRCRADRERCRESCYQSLLHSNSSLRDVPAVKKYF